MPELRKDPVVGRWVIISSERAKRPTDFARLGGGPPGSTRSCPFCYDHEDETPPEIFALRADGADPDTPDWSVRVVPNKFPALRIEGELGRGGDGIYDFMNGVGAHEVVIETPDHDATIAGMDVDQIVAVLSAVRSRSLDLNGDPRFQYIQVFKNRGKEAGASLEHPHTQIIATPIVPKRIVEELEGARAHFDRTGRCIYCDMVAQEIGEESRLVDATEAFIGLAPYAPRFPFETWLLPREHHASFEHLPEDLLPDLAVLLKRTMSRIDRVLGVPPYNFLIHTAPCKNPDLEHYHLHFEIMPKLTRVAGFEWGSGFYINPTPPELAAEALRGAGDAGPGKVAENPAEGSPQTP